MVVVGDDALSGRDIQAVKHRSSAEFWMLINIECPRRPFACRTGCASAAVSAVVPCAQHCVCQLQSYHAGADPVRDAVSVASALVWQKALSFGMLFSVVKLRARHLPQPFVDLISCL